MLVFLKSKSLKVWEIVDEGPFIPSKKVNGEKVEKQMDEWSDSDKKLISFNHKPMHILFCALTRDQFNKVQQCLNAYEIWHRLEVTYEGTN